MPKRPMRGAPARKSLRFGKECRPTAPPRAGSPPQPSLRRSPTFSAKAVSKAARFSALASV